MNLYHKKFLESFSSENVIGVFSRYARAAKEITESWAMLEAAKKFIPNLDDHLVIVVGDGCSPRTGVLFAYYTNAEVISFDPNFNMAHWHEHCEKQTAMGFAPKRISVIKERIEERDINCEGKNVLVVWPHSHADMNGIRLINATDRTDIAMPCCVKIPDNWASRLHLCYDDINVISPKRTVHVWREKNETAVGAVKKVVNA